MCKVYNVEIKEHLGSCESGSALNAIIDGEMMSTRWAMQSDASPGCVAVMFDKYSRRPLHVGVVVDSRNILHSPDDTNRSGSQIHQIKLLNRVFSKLEYYKYDNGI